MDETRPYLEHDWYGGDIPSNIQCGTDVYIDSSYAFAAFESRQNPGLILGDASGVYDRAAFVVGERGCVTVGRFTCLNATYLVCAERISIGDHCLLAWGAVVTDCWPDGTSTLVERRNIVRLAAQDHTFPMVESSRPVIVEDNVWVGFDAVILPGVTLGRGCVVGCRTVVDKNVPPYAIVVGNPARVVRYLEPTDTEQVREDALRRYHLD